MSREIAILIDGGFLTKRLGRLVANPEKLTPMDAAVTKQAIGTPAVC